MLIISVTANTMLHPLNAIQGSALDALREHFTFPNPEYTNRERLGLWLGGTPRELCFLQEYDGTLASFPRGATMQVLQILKAHGLNYRLDDRRRVLPEVDFTFSGTLREYQQEAVDAVLRRNFGTLAAPTGSGKTTMALAVIAKRRQAALVVVHTRELMDQWVSRIEAFLGLPEAEIGRIGGGKHTIGERITVALVQSLYKCAAEVAPHIGHLIVDECHRAPSRTFTEAVNAFDCRFMLGLSATPYRRDGLSRLIYWYLGDKVHEVERAPLIENGDILPAQVITRETAFTPSVDPSTEYSRMLSELTQDPHRNALIVQDVATEARNGGGACLVLSDRKAHCEELRARLAGVGIDAAVLTGDLDTRERHQVVEGLNGGAVKVLVATGQLVGEGFDCPQLETLFLATPIKFTGRTLQYLGRILRPAPGKKARVVDYVDSKVGVLVNAARQRVKAYRQAG